MRSLWMRRAVHGHSHDPRASDIAILQLPHIANFDDFDPLLREPGVQIRYVKNVADLGCPRAVIIPGTKSTLADLAWLRERGLESKIQALAQQGVAIVGICGGFQMLGTLIRDPALVEADVDHLPGLGLLPLVTEFAADKRTEQVSAIIASEALWLAPLAGQRLKGYEIHMGRTCGGQTWMRSESRGATDGGEGAMSADGKIWGCYFHGLFANDAFRGAWLSSLGQGPVETLVHDDDAELTRLADVVESSLNMDCVHSMLTD